jgi:anaerobic selenocysteine-containing dehydrogenase
VSGKFLAVIDPCMNRLVERADVVMPGATWLEKAGTFQNARDMLQAFEAAIPTQHQSKTEGQIAADLVALLHGDLEHTTDRQRATVIDEGPGSVPGGLDIAPPIGAWFNVAHTRQAMAERSVDLGVFVSDVRMPSVEHTRESDMELLEL